MMASNMQNTNQMVVVWEWMNEFGVWRPYDPHVSDFLEKNSNVSTLGQTSFNLGHADQSLAMYSADFTTMCQVRFGTGTARPIRRTLYPLTSPPGKGIVWQWEGDLPGQWHNYDLQVSIVVEDYFSQNSNSLGQLDLSKSPVKLPYVLDLHNMTQTRIETGRVRQLRRDFLNSPYTISSQNSGCNVTPASNHVRLGTKRRANGSCSFINNQKRGRSNVLPSQASNMQSGQVPGFATSSSVLSQGGGLHTSNTQMAHGPVTRKKLNMMSASQVSQCNQQIHPFVYPKLQSQPPSQGSSIHQPHQQQQITSNSVPLTQQGISQFGQSSGSFLHNVNMTSHSSLQPGAMQFPNQFGSVQQGSHMLQNSGQQPNGVINFHGNNTGISVPGALLGRSKNASRISPVVTSATNLLMSPAVPMLLSNSSSSGGMTQFNLPLEDRIPNNAPKAKKHASNKASNCDIFDKYTTVVDKPAEDEDCCICCEKLNQASGYGEDKQDSHIVFKLEKCNHMFHKLCIQAMYDSGSKNGCLQCPTCKTIYGEKNGNCPSGVMEYHRLSQSLPSYEDCHTIQILYHISPGIQGPEHPHPGKRYSCRGFPRVCYLPDNEKGRKVLKLLTVAWKRRLTFTIGMSTTTGESDTVTWNEIHHKTEFGTNHSGHGYPDANYLENVLMELAVHGVTECDL